MINPKNNIEDNKEVSFIPMTLISDGFSNKHSYEVRLWGDVKKGFTHFQEGDIGIAKITPCFENRKSVIFSNLVNEVGAGTTELHVLRPFAYSEIKKYIYWFINTESFIQRGISHFSGAVGQQRVGKDILENTLFPLPPLSEQRRIVEKIEELLTLVDDLETNKTDLQSYINQAKSKVLEMAVRGELVPQNPDDEPASALLERIKKEQKSSKSKGKTTEHNTHYEEELLFDIPKNWALTRMENICQLLDGEKKQGVELPYLDVKFLRGKIEGEIKESGKYIPKNTHLILVDGENSGEIFKAQQDGYQGSTLKILNISEEICKKYIFYILKKEQKLFKESKTGSAIPHLNKKLFNDLLIFLPPLAEQHRIVEKIEHIFAVLEELEENIL